MVYEVENKFPIADPAGLVAALTELGAQFGPPVPQADRYFNHPARDFASTDEALRIRSVGEQTWLTYKGPKIDGATKTRREIELPIGRGTDVASQLGETLEALGFRPVATVRKQRRSASLPWQGRSIACTLDEVEQVGTFAELEAVASEGELESARAAILSLAARLGLPGPERRSYLEMLLAGEHSR
jgi:adenylate cyclase class 2